MRLAALALRGIAGVGGRVNGRDRRSKVRARKLDLENRAAGEKHQRSHEEGDKAAGEVIPDWAHADIVGKYG